MVAKIGAMSSVGRSGCDTPVEAFYGDLLEEVALLAPVARPRLVAALEAVDRSADVAGAPTEEYEVARVATLPVAEWNRLARRTGLRPEMELAVREVHRRMAAAIGATEACATQGADPCVVIEDYRAASG